MLKRTLLATTLLSLLSLPAMAATDHSDMVKGPFKTGEDVTKACLECHEQQAAEFMKTTHWTWQGTPNHVKGMEKSTKTYGKINMINSFCTSVQGAPDGMALEACGKCHAGYGMTSRKFDFTQKSKIDCLICHAQKGNYTRANIGCDIDMKAIEKGAMNLEEAAKSVGKPGIKNCGACHFYGGGADAVKHAGLDSSTEFATRKQDIHLAKKAKGGLEMGCIDCHKSKEHRITGASSTMAHHDGHISCEDCHTGANAPHQKSKNAAVLNRHAKTVACQTCHIPLFSKGQATKMAWYWSDVGKDIESKEEFDKETFDKKKGTFVWGKDVKPVYAWYNGQIERYMVGDKVKDPKKPVVMARPVGDIRDKTAKIYPYKLYKGDQPMDAKYGHLNIFQQYKSLWKDFDWEKALKSGAQSSGLPYSGKFTFVKTEAYIAANHEVSPKEDALKCADCHGTGGRLDWKALGYKGDPQKTGGRFSKQPEKKKAEKKK